MAPDRFWSLLVFGAFTVVYVMGGASELTPARVWIITSVSAAIFVLAAYRLGDGFPSRLALLGLVIALSGMALAALQLVPLAPSLWTSFPGRQFLVDTLQADGMEAGPMPLSLSPLQTKRAIVAMLPGVAFFAAALTVPTRQRGWLALVAGGLAIINVLLALGRRAGIFASIWGGMNPNEIGFFFNRNLYAAALYSTLPLMVAYALPQFRKSRGRALVATLVSAAYLGVVIVGLAQSTSRAGILFAIVTILAVTALGFRRGPFVKRSSTDTSRLAIWGVLAGLVLIGQFGLVGIARLAATDPLSDYRRTIASNSIDVAIAYFPLGSGFGTFVPVFQMFETPSMILSQYVNHAHNDWLELLIEGGLPAGILLAAFLLWYAAGFIRAWRVGLDSVGDLMPRAMTISTACLLAHSFVDFPLRDPNLMALFAMGCGFMAGRPAPVRQRTHNHLRNTVTEEIIRNPAVARFGSRKVVGQAGGPANDTGCFRPSGEEIDQVGQRQYD